MKHVILVAVALLCLAGCAGSAPTTEPDGPTVDSALDGSASPLSRAEVLAIAALPVRAREHWREDLPNDNGSYHQISYEARRLNQGAWRVIARSVERVTYPPDEAGALHLLSIPAAVLIIDRHGRVISYLHSANPEFDYPPPG